MLRSADYQPAQSLSWLALVGGMPAMSRLGSNHPRSPRELAHACGAEHELMSDCRQRITWLPDQEGSSLLVAVKWPRLKSQHPRMSYGMHGLSLGGGVPYVANTQRATLPTPAPMRRVAHAYGMAPPVERLALAGCRLPPLALLAQPGSALQRPGTFK